MNRADDQSLPIQQCVAIIGMACHFPDARTPEEFWRNLAQGRESVRDYDEASLRAAGVDEADLSDPAYVRRGIPLEGFDCFDAAFFGISPGDAKIMDPQHRRFLECAWSAMEDAGHTSASVDGNIGVFAGSGMDWYLLRNLMTNPALIRELGEFHVRHTANDKDFLATRASYHLDLRGPSINVQTACSSSLVAVHLACQSLLNGESDMALAGGSTIDIPQQVGYLYRPEEVRSPDGHCRAMDAAAAGTAFGSGCGVVVLRRLQDALDDGDTVLAVIRGSAVNNDGAGKAGYLAPSVDGQAEVIAEAIALASIDPDTIGYVEAHGTGTSIGDPIEVAALTQGFGPTVHRQYCALGSVKTNIGHLDCAAGVAGLIKIVLSMRHRKLPPSLHFRSPNPEIDFVASPFHVNTVLSDWPALGAPLRAGISSLGVGGTNAHVVLEEAPRTSRDSVGTGAVQPGGICVLPLSARTPAALTEAVSGLLAHLAEHPGLPLSDVAWTLRAGRRPFTHRTAVAGRDTGSIIAGLRAFRQGMKAAEAPPGPVLMFPGQGAQYPRMACRMDAMDPHFRAAMDACVAVLEKLGRRDAIQALRPGEPSLEACDSQSVEALRETALTQPVMFCVEYALARSLLARGVRPVAMIGHSLGEYVAACLAGIFTLEAAVTLVCRRGELIALMPPGAMLAVALGRQDVQEYLCDRVCLAGINGPESCVCAGDVEAISGLAERLRADGIGTRRLETSHAFHSHMLEPVLPAFREAVLSAGPVAVEDPRIVSNVTGTWLTASQGASAEYWVQHLRQPVNFEAGIRHLRTLGSIVHIEVGPGATLAGLARAIVADARVIPTLPRQGDPTPDDEVFARAAGLLWAHGADVDWPAWGQPAGGRRVQLPTYPFQRQRHWVEPGKPSANAVPVEPSERRPLSDWFHTTDWQSSVAAGGEGKFERVLVFAGTWGVAASLVERLRQRNVEVVTVQMGTLFSHEGGRIVLDPGVDADWDMLANAAGTFSHLVYLWPLDTAMACAPKIVAGCFDHLLRIGKRIDRLCDPTGGMKLLVASANAHQLGGEAVANPYQALVCGPVRTIPQEYPAVRARWVDLDAANVEWDPARTTEQLLLELETGGDEETVAWRQGRRFRPVLTPMPLCRPTGDGALRQGGTYLITGGFGGAGQALAQYLARRYRAHLVLVSRTGLPQSADYDAYLLASAPGDETRRRIQLVRMLQSAGARVEVVTADVADGKALELAVSSTGVVKLDGIFHAAGVLDDSTIALKHVLAAHRVLHPKVAGTLGLQSLMTMKPAFVLYFSSLSAQTAVAGQVDYTSANAFLDAFAASADSGSRSTRHLAVEWSIWRDAGMAAALAARSGLAPSEPALADLVDHPVLTWGTHDSAGRHCYQGMLTAESVWFLDQHRLKSGDAILPGTAYIDLIAAAVRLLHGDFVPFRLCGLMLMAPLVLRPREKRLLRLQIDEAGPGEYRMTVSSAGADAEDVLDHAVAEMSLEMGDPDHFAPEPITPPMSLIPGAYSHPSLVFGSRWDCLTRLEAGASDALLRLDLKTPGDLVDHPLHPALLDMAVGAAQQVLAGPELGARLLPYRYGEILVLAPLAGSITSHVHARCEQDQLRLDVQIRSADGALLLVFRDFILKQAPTAALARTSGAESRRPKHRATNAILEVGFQDGLSNPEAMAAIELILANNTPPQVIVATRDAKELISQTRAALGLVSTVASADADATTAFLDRPELAVDYVVPRTDLERTLASAWEAMLEIRGVGTLDDFFELGGNSLLLMRLVSRLARQQGIALPLEKALEEPTIACWSELLSDANIEPRAPVETIRRVDRSRHRITLSS